MVLVGADRKNVVTKAIDFQKIYMDVKNIISEDSDCSKHRFE